ncbi:ECF transporter S component [Bacillus carboniphilus]|uniref:Riboflavin transporter n=1 Tax=Bacillus carboniphilus TaxID=86663 RepID=A0ABY9JZ91_9BACI|nr:ECF transporter S component [Bacillus carboniphilus]WLR43770.1 ECF transporter S component [Bacillus carboniphilus]
MKVKKLVTVSMLGSLSFLLMMLDFPFPGFPPFLKIDFSDIPAVIAAIMFGPISGILVEFLKNGFHYLFTSSQTGVPIGQFANFLAGSMFVIPVALMFKKLNSTKGLVVGIGLGTLIMTIGMAIANYFVIFPLYAFFMNIPEMPIEKIVKIIMPFNMLKGLIVGMVFLMVYKRLSKWITTQVV